MLGLGSGINKLSAAEAAAIAGRIPGFTGLLDESYGSGAAAAYSVRKLTNRVSVAMTIRRDSDSTETDIGFDSNGNLNEGAITAFCTGTTCRVASWKDQSGNDNHAVQTTAANQPIIYTGGAIVKENGRVSVDFDGTDDFVATSDFTAEAQPFYFSIVATPSATTLARFIDTNGTDTNNRINITLSNGSIYEMNAGNSITGGTATTTQQLLTADFDTTSSFLYKDGTQIITGDAGTRNIDSVRIGANKNGIQVLNGTIQEVVFYNSDKSTDRTSIESNIGDYFTQNTPLLDTYTGAAAAYSLRQLSSSYSGAAIRVRRDNDNLETDINFNVFGELDTVSLAAHCGSNNGYVTNWYDQSSNSNTARQTTAANQPKIYDSSTGVVTENGKPAVQFDGSNDILKQSGGLLNGLNSYSLFSTFNPLTSATAYEAYLHQAVVTTPFNNTFELRRDNANDRFNPISGQSLPLQNTTSSINNSQLLVSILRNGATTNKIYQNGTFEKDLTSNSYTINAGDFEIGGRSSDVNFASMKAQEFVIYGNDQSSNRTNIESNINTFYSVY